MLYIILPPPLSHLPPTPPAPPVGPALCFTYMIEQSQLRNLQEGRLLYKEHLVNSSTVLEGQDESQTGSSQDGDAMAESKECSKRPLAGGLDGRTNLDRGSILVSS